MKWWVKSTKIFKWLQFTLMLLSLASAITRCVSISVFASLVGDPAGTAG